MPEDKKICPDCNAELRPAYTWVPTPEAGTVADVEPRETNNCPFCGSEVEDA